jgi:hypothetical protein
MSSEVGDARKRGLDIFGRGEAVQHPNHYGGDVPYEAIKVIHAWGLNFCLGNAAKYICRAGKKPDNSAIQDLRKARWYIDWEITRLEKQEQENGS